MPKIYKCREKTVSESLKVIDLLLLMSTRKKEKKNGIECRWSL